MILNEEEFELAKQRDNILCQCDYCGNIFPRTKHNIIRSWKNIKNDSCVSCVSKKRIDVSRLLFGTDNVFQNENIKQKIKETCLEKYGVESHTQTKEYKENYIKACLDKYGVINVFQNEDIKEKIKETLLERYGVENVMHHNVHKDKQHATMLTKHGVCHALQKNEFQQKSYNTCIKNHGYFPVNNYGKTQKELQDWINALGFNFSSNISLLKNKEIDLFDENKKIAFEYCGLNWHHEQSPEPRLKNYHFDKYQRCLEQGVQLITIFSDEWLLRKQQCCNHIQSLLGITNKVFARKCQISEVDKYVASDFIEEHHIQGRNKLGFKFFGLYDESDLVGIISLGKHHRNKSENVVLDRLCFKENVQVVGGASKLFKQCILWAKTNNYQKIVSFSDNRWSNGNIYKVLNFNLEYEYGPCYNYVDVKNPRKRLSKQSQKKSSVRCPQGKTELQWAYERGLSRIWDCGKKRWGYNLI